MSPQGIDVIQKTCGDVFAVRMHGLETNAVKYDAYQSAGDSAPASFSLRGDQAMVYPFLKQDLGNERVLLGYAFSTKAVTPDKTGVLTPTITVERSFSEFLLNPSNANLAADNLRAARGSRSAR